MRKLTPALLVLGAMAAPAFAQTPLTFAQVDADGNGELSFVELQVVWPDLTQEEFDAADADLSGGLNSNELNSLQPGAVPVPGNALSNGGPAPESLVDNDKE
ncbi:MAG: hypothetical protein KIS86_16990 [Devosia sp.]|nr:hypothetical protein [Devosia sp.]